MCPGYEYESYKQFDEDSIVDFAIHRENETQEEFNIKKEIDSLRFAQNNLRNQILEKEKELMKVQKIREAEARKQQIEEERRQMLPYLEELKILSEKYVDVREELRLLVLKIANMPSGDLDASDYIADDINAIKFVKYYLEKYIK